MGAHIRSDDVLLVVSASGHRHALLDATAAARAAGATVWAITPGLRPNPLAQAADEAICINAPKPQVREAQLIALQAMSECLAAALHTLSAGRELR